MRIVLVGAVEGSGVALDALNGAGRPPSAVVTLPSLLANRHSDFADIATRAREEGSEVIFATDINAPDSIEAIRASQPDVCLVIGWSQVCGQDFRACARLGNIGFHPAPLPRLRGRAVIPWTILLGEKESASTLFWLDDGVDSGDIALQQAFPLDPNESARTLYTKHMANLAIMLPKIMAMIEAGNAPNIPQDHGKATYCAKRTPEDGLIDWKLPAASILTLIRAVGSPFPGAYSFCNGVKLIIDKAEPFADSHRFIGLAGQVQAHTSGGFIVRCGDGQCIAVRAWRWTGGHLPKIHNRLDRQT